MTPLPAVSVILSSRNRPELLLASVRSILAGSDVPRELLVVDQSDLENAELASLKTGRGCELRYIKMATVGLSKANNLGVHEARHELLVFTHDDVLVTPEWLREIVTALVRAGRCAVVTGRVLPARAETRGGFVPTLKVDEHPATYHGRIWEDVLYPLNMAMYRSALDEVGPFDERLGPGTAFPGGEDNDLGYRLLEAKYSIHYVPQAVLYHRAWRGGHERLKLRWSYGRAQGAFYAKHSSFGDPYMIRRARREFAKRGKVLIQYARAPWVALDQAVSMFAIVCGACQWLLKRRRNP